VRTRIHLNLQVRDLERSIHFYEALLGAAPSKTRDDYANWRLDEPALHLALVHVPEHRNPTTGEHFGIELFADEDLDAWRRRVEAAGLTARREEAVTCCYAVADKFWVADPDGNEWEFWVRHEEAESMHGADAMPLATLGGLGTPFPAGGCCVPTPDDTGCCAPAPDGTSCC
jgi:catechol 2,3-dioxygenase-like lactoylglutathione lyase family enzyme